MFSLLSNVMVYFKDTSQGKWQGAIIWLVWDYAILDTF